MIRFTLAMVAIATMAAVAAVAAAADHDIVKLRNGQKLLGYADFLNEGSLTFVDLDGKTQRIRLVTIDNIVFAAHAKPEQERPILVAKRNPKGEFRSGSLDASAPEMPEGTSIAYLCWGDDSLKRNSLPFEIGQPSILYVAFIPDGPSPFASLMVHGTNQSSSISASILNHEFGDPNHTVFGSQLIYDCGSGEAYADIEAQNCDWLVAVVNSDRVPTRATIEAAGARLLEIAKWRKMELAR